MKLWMICLGILFGYGIFFLWPIKLRIHKKHGRVVSNSEILELVKNGDPDAIRLKKMTKLFFVIGGLFALSYGFRFYL